MNKKKLETTLLALLGVTLIVASVILLGQKKQSTILMSAEEGDSFPHFDQHDRGLHVFSESGILL